MVAVEMKTSKHIDKSGGISKMSARLLYYQDAVYFTVMENTEKEQALRCRETKDWTQHK